MRGPSHFLYQPQRELFAVPFEATKAQKIEAFIRFPLVETWADIACIRVGDSFIWGLVCSLEPDFPRTCPSHSTFMRPRWSRIPKPETVAAIYRLHFAAGS